jgi:hypothetical protein
MTNRSATAARVAASLIPFAEVKGNVLILGEKSFNQGVKATLARMTRTTNKLVLTVNDDDQT